MTGLCQNVSSRRAASSAIPRRCGGTDLALVYFAAMRPVRLGSESDGRYIVHEGITVGDRVVTNGSFMLRAEYLKTKQGT